MELRLGIVGGKGGGLAEHAQGIGGAVEGQVGLPQAVQAHGVVGAQSHGGFQVSEGAFRLTHLVVQAAALGVGRGKSRVERHRAVVLGQCLRRIVLVLNGPQFVVADGVVGVAGHKTLNFRQPLFEEALLKGHKASFAAGHIIVRHEFQIMVPSRGGVVQGSQVSGRHGE